MVTIKEALGHIKDYCYLGDLRQEDFEDRMTPLLKAAAKGDIPNLSIANGLTKGVVIFAGSPFVIKIPFQGIGGNRDDFHGSNSKSSYEWDYCAREVEVYESAALLGLAHLLARTKRIGMINDTPIYSQAFVPDVETVSVYDEADEFCSAKEYQQASRLADAKTTGEAKLSRHLTALLIKMFGYRATQRFMNFCVKEKIGSDWHSGNFGMIDNRIIFCDYTGFNH